jgi:protein TonB
VLIELYIDETGTVERVAILRAEPPGVFDASVKRAFSAARFTPGMKEGRPVPVLMTLEIEFESQRPQAQR